ncbi:Hypothetical protein PHPALM_6126 [Phytophthora palmivora]|uniref:Uncharacterized protein n=1 Tax=Phytophthora palmivora TaxID=4796 RepID=A0A2P4YFP5_9STRA|nr:Hypothetical protein PHPALM_6126 [Phytophthora palmivora]
MLLATDEIGIRDVTFSDSKASQAPKPDSKRSVSKNHRQEKKKRRDVNPHSRIVGYFFHFKQALRRKMLKLKITEEEVALATREVCIDGLTLIRRCDIVFRGIPDVRRMIKRDYKDQGILYSRKSWKTFWKYFTNTWIMKFVPEWWNVNDLNEDIVNRTNNPLERYNHTPNDAFSVPHPDVVQFISVIEKQSRDNVRLINDIPNHRARAPSHASPQRAPRFESDYQLEVESESDLADSDDSNSDIVSVVSVSPKYKGF